MEGPGVSVRVTVTALVLIGVLAWLALPAPVLAETPEDTVGVVDTTSGLWYLRQQHEQSGTFSTYRFLFGVPGDIPIVGDWDCDGWDTPGMFRPTDGYVYLRNHIAIGEGDVRFYVGSPGDVPITGDFDGDGCDTVSLYRPSQGRVFIFDSLGSGEQGLGAASYSFYYGNPLDKPFVGDFDDDDVDTVGLHRESTGQVFLRNSNTQGIADSTFYYGDPGDRIIAGDWAQKDDVPGPDTVGIFRPFARTMFLRFSNTPGVADVDFLYGNPRLVPVAGNFIDVQGSLNDKPSLEAELTLQLSTDPSSGECQVILTWGDWRGPLHASIRLDDRQIPSRAPTDTFSGIITTTGNETDSRHTFNVDPSTYTASGTISTGDIATGQSVHWIDTVNSSSEAACG